MSSAPPLALPAAAPAPATVEPWPAAPFLGTVARHLASVRPAAAREIARWRAAAMRIPNPVLRAVALGSLEKRGNIEGAALFATLTPRPTRRAAVRALVAYQTAYNYLDALAELPANDAQANNRFLHQALRRPFLPADAAQPDYYRRSPYAGDGGYLSGCVEVCRAAFTSLPAHASVRASALAAAERIVDFQSLNLTNPQGGHARLRAWATPASAGLTWWETAAAAGSSLAVHALIAAAATPSTTAGEATALEAAYFPWAGALHSLLDSLADRREDTLDDRQPLIDYYPSPAAGAERLAFLADGALSRLARAPGAHRAILAAMCSYYLTARECEHAEARGAARALGESFGASLTAALALFRVRRAIADVARQPYV